YGANIQLMYIGVVAAGGNIPNDPALAASIAIPAAILNGLDTGAAVAIAVPFGVMGVMINNLRRTINTFTVSVVDKAIESGNFKKVHSFQFVIPWLINGVLYMTPVFLINLIGPSLIQKIVEVIPSWLQSGIANAGNMLPALGFALTLVVMGKEYMPYFLLGFFLYAVTGFSMLTGAIIALALGMIVESVSTAREGGTE
ncbi:MAG: PTS sugar transporter subunit IIC, partial [Atopobium sp.]|nr:PTS sugar transporter subunit IIC [Atopobium sp.]